MNDPGVFAPSAGCTRNIWVSCASVAFAVIVTCLAYLPSLGGDFLFDDLSEIVENPAIRVLWPPWRSMFEGGELPHRPLPYYSFAINHAVWGDGPFGYRVVNLAIHLVNGWLLWTVVEKTLRLRGLRDSRWIAWISALLWLVHPIQSQAVAYVYQRIELLAATSALATLAAFITAADATGRTRYFFQLASVIACAAGMACKEWVVVVPPVVLLYDVLLITGSWRATLAARWRLHVALFATWGILAGIIRSQQRFYPEFATAHTALGADSSRRLFSFLNQPAVILWYLSLLVAPVGQSLDHGTPLRTTWWLAGPLILAAAAFGAFVMNACRTPGVSFLGITFFLLLAPTSSILPLHDVCVEHRMYLPSAVVAVALACGMVAAIGPRLAGIAAVCLAVALAAVTCNRATVYASPLTAWTDAVAKSPTSSRARSRLATELSKAERHAEAIAMAEEAVALRPENPVGYAALAAVLLNADRSAAAAEVAQRGLALEAAQTDAGPGWINPIAMRLARYRGEALVRLGDASGIPLLEAAVEASPDSLDAAESLARALAPVEPHRAAELYRRLVVAAPYDPRLRYDLGCVLIGIDAAAAERELREAIRLNPTSDAALNNLAGLLFAVGRLEEAIVAYRRCLEVNPQHPLASANLRAAEAALRAHEGG